MLKILNHATFSELNRLKTMLLLLFQIGEDLYAIETKNVIEIVPMVMLKKTPSEEQAGVLNYHGKLVPVIDLSHLIYGKPSQVCYSTRIVLMQTQIGLIAERVTETVKLSIEEAQTIEFANHAPYLGKLMLMNQGMAQLIRWEHFVPKALAEFSTEGR